MQYVDAIYGKVKIAEPLLVDLIASDAMQRAKGISQHGITALLGITPPFSRFDHSIGAMLLVRHLGASLNEQVAALLHDISHTAFSHVIDFVYEDHCGQSYHEEKKGEFVANSDIPMIMELHGMDWRDFMDEEQFSLLEQPLPGLCADRLDYFFRDLEFLKLATRDEIQTVFNSLVVDDQCIVVNSLDIARWLAYTFIETDQTSWSNIREVGLYQLTAVAIKKAIQHGVFNELDIWGTDEMLWKKLQSAELPEIKSLVKHITPGTRFTRNESRPDFYVATKVRSIDPLVIVGNSVDKLSSLDPVFAQYRNEYLASKQGQWPMGVVNPPEDTIRETHFII